MVHQLNVFHFVLKDGFTLTAKVLYVQSHQKVRTFPGINFSAHNIMRGRMATLNDIASCTELIIKEGCSGPERLVARTPEKCGFCLQGSESKTLAQMGYCHFEVVYAVVLSLFSVE